MLETGRVVVEPHPDDDLERLAQRGPGLGVERAQLLRGHGRTTRNSLETPTPVVAPGS